MIRLDKQGTKFFEKVGFMSENDEADRHFAGMELEVRALVMWRQYGFLMPKTAKQFFNDLAGFLGWANLKEATK